MTKYILKLSFYFGGSVSLRVGSKLPESISYIVFFFVIILSMLFIFYNSLFCNMVAYCDKSQTILLEHNWLIK